MKHIENAYDIYGSVDDPWSHFG